MVKLARGGKNNGPMLGRQKPRPLFPPGELPLFGPPPAYMRRPPGPPRPPPSMGPMGYGPPPPPPMRPPPHHMGPPMPPPPPMRHRPRPVLPPPGPPLPLLQAPIMPPRPLPFLRGGRLKPPMGRMGMGMGMGKRLGKPMKKTKNKKNKNKPAVKNDGEHYCESCDRGWETSEELDEHLATHVSCDYDNCNFTAHPKIIAVHVKLQHVSGLFDRIKFSYNKEEIVKWREERKRNYPTQLNIQEKLAAAKEKEDRGERMNDGTSRLNRKFRQRGETKHNKMNSLHTINKSDNLNEKGELKPNRRRKRLRKTLYIPSEQISTDRDIVMEEAKCVIKNLIIEEEKPTVEENSCFSDEEWNNVEKNCSETPKVCNVLAALSAAYNSDSEADDGEAPKEDSSKSQVTTPNVYIKEDTSKVKWSKEKLVPNDQSSKNLQKNLQITQVTRSQKQKYRQPTLLEKLLASEIRQERNYILQCIRYIINNNYFQDENKNQNTDLEKDSLREGNDISCSS